MAEPYDPLEAARRRAAQYGGAQPSGSVAPPQPAAARRPNPPVSGGVSAAPPASLGDYNSPENRRKVVEMQNRLVERQNARSGGGAGPTGGGGRGEAPSGSARLGLTGLVQRLFGKDQTAYTPGTSSGPTRRNGPRNPSARTPAFVEDGSGLRFGALPDDAVVGTYNGKALTKAEANARAAALSTGNPFEGQLAGASRRGGAEAPMGYQGRGLRTSKRPGVDDKYQLQRDLASLGRGSPTIRAALMQRYNDQFNNAERGQNDMAVTDLQAAARGQENFADRQMAGDQFDRTEALELARFDAARNESNARINIYDEMRKNAAALREQEEFDEFGLRGGREKLNAERVAAMVATDPSLTREAAEAKVARGQSLIDAGFAKSLTEADALLANQEELRGIFDPGTSTGYLDIRSLGDEGVQTAWSAAPIEDGIIDPNQIDEEKVGFWRDIWNGPGDNYRFTYTGKDGKQQGRYGSKEQAAALRRGRELYRRPPEE